MNQPKSQLVITAMIVASAVTFLVGRALREPDDRFLVPQSTKVWTPSQNDRSNHSPNYSPNLASDQQQKVHPQSQKITPAKPRRDQFTSAPKKPVMIRKLPAFRDNKVQVASHIKPVKRTTTYPLPVENDIPRQSYTLRVPTQEIKKLPRPRQDVASQAPSLESPSQTDPARVDKQVRKANWAEIEPIAEQIIANSLNAPAVNFMDQPALPRQQTRPQVETQAQKHIQYGDSLARRRSLFAAREEFVLALLLISNSHKSGTDSDVYAQRLAQGLTAMDEVSDFAAMRSGGDLLRRKVLSHKTKLLAGDALSTTTPKNAMELYFRFAQTQLQQAIGFSSAGSKALHALGKLETMAPANSQESFARQTKALLFFRAALDANPSNALCANDMGVLLFNMGRLDEAEITLKSSLQITPTHRGLKNLEALHRQRATNATSAAQRKHQNWLASVAAKEAEKIQSNPRDRGLAANQWATVSEFQNNAAIPDTALQKASATSGDNTSVGPNGNRSGSFIDKVKGWN